MAWPGSLNVALKEWASVCRALADGRQMLLLRKGGIYEAAGEFEVEHRAFLLFPTNLQQKLTMLKESEYASFGARATEPDEITIAAAGVVTDIIELKSREQMDALDDENVWTPPLIDMRFNYRPENPLYLLLVRAYRLRQPVKIANTPAYAGCKSWVPLKHSINTGSAAPVMDDVKYGHRRERILKIACLNGP
jgi:hypothetical protein